MPEFPRDRPHLHVEGGGATEPYARPPRKITPRPLPARDREAHAQALETAIADAIAAARQRLADREPAIAEGLPGFYLEIEVQVAEAGVIDQLADRRKKMEVVAVREGPPPVEGAAASIAATVFVPLAAENYYQEKVDQYRSRDTDKGRPANEPLISRIESFRPATARSLFTDPPELYPPPDRATWWEVWLRTGHRVGFERVAERIGIRLKPHVVRFREREVILALGDEAAIDRLLINTDAIAELRAAKDTPALFLGLNGGEQRAWSDDLIGRLVFPPGNAPAVTLLDSGVTQGHPLIQPLLDPADALTVEPTWSAADNSGRWRGHGTAMAGVALYGDLTPLLTAATPIALGHRLESVRILPVDTDPDTDPELYGALTKEAIARAEIRVPDRRRAISLAVTASRVPRGRPSSWSATIDQLCFDEDVRRLIIVSAGNVRDDLTVADHCWRNDLEPAEDPAQAWNALTVGAYTDKVNVTDLTYAGWRPIAPAGELSPRSRTSVPWDWQWPIKPDVVFEGGNLASDGGLPGEAIDDLQLLTTHNRPVLRLFNTLGDTSGATALASHMAGRILTARPWLWPETIRGLIIHSAEWTPPMQAQVDACNGRRNRLQALLRRYGYGVPELGRALLSAANDLTLIVEDDVHPFARAGSAPPTMRDMKVHVLPWPREQLAAIGEAPVELHVTLSYFIEPNPGERGWTRRHRYASHGLRFAVKWATETVQEFRARINKAARDEEEGGSATEATNGDEWLLGQIRDRGSIHSDRWFGTAADLASRDAIGVFPVGGWWKEKPYLERWDTVARYALIVTIRAANSNVDIYTPVATLIAAHIET